MTTHYESLKKSITQEMYNSAASTLNEDKGRVASAVSILLPTLLVKFIDKSETPKMTETVKEAGKLNLFDKRADLFAGHGIEGGKNLGERFENELIGVNNQGLPNAVAAEAGVAKESADRLSNWVSGLIAGYVGQKVNDGAPMSKVMGELRSERNNIIGNVPAKAAQAVGIKMAAQTACNAGAASNASKAPVAKKKSNSWLIWLIAALLILLIVILAMRSCRHNEVNIRHKEVIVENIVEDAGKNTGAMDMSNRVYTTHTLPNGQTVRFLEGGCEDCMIKYLDSEEYKKADNNELNKMWFHFDRIDFEHGSAVQLDKEGEEQLHNIAKILKNHPDAKVRIAGMADKTGSNAVNMNVSKERAEYVKSFLVKDGIDAKRISTDAFGEEFASVPENASEAQRAIDRSIAMRFVK